MNLSMRQIRAFLYVARAGSFTRAAEHAHMTQAGLSILVREVERQLGARLFDRTTRAVQLTAAGRRFALVAEAVLRQLDDASAEVGEMGRAAREQLRIAATPLVSAHLLPQLLARFRDANPGLRIQLLDGSLPAVQEMVESGAADMGLGFFFKVASGLARRHVADFALMRVAPAGAPPQQLGRAPWAALRDATLITLPADNPIQRATDAHLHKVGIVPREMLPVSFLATLIAMVEAGFGQAVVPTFAVAACRLHNVRIDVLGPPRLRLGFYRITRQGAAETDEMRAFGDALAQHLPSMSR